MDGSSEKKGGILVGMIWMLIISLLLFWLPVFGPLIAGFAGGKKSGGIGKAICAVFLPAIIFGVLLSLFSGLISGMPLIGAIAGAGGFIFVLAEIGPLLVGAIVGGAFS